MKRLYFLAYLLLVLASSPALSQQDKLLRIESVERRATPTIRHQRFPEFLVARSITEWAAVWKLPYVDQHGAANGSPPVLPIVDFRSSMIVGIILPTHATGCTGVTIFRATASNRQVVVKYHERKPQATDVCTTSFATAYNFVKVERSLLPVVFSEEE